MRLGQVILWKNFPHQIDSDIKPRWFIYIGKYTYGSLNQDIYLYTTTTKSEHYEAGGRRAKNLIIRFKKGQYGFAENCILDVDVGLHVVQESEVCNNPDISVVGQIPGSLLRRLYGLILRSHNISRMIRIDIYTSYNLADITGLTRPK